MQVGAVRAEIAGPVLRAEHALHLRRRHDGAALPVAHDMAIRLEGDRLERLVEAEGDQHPHGVGAELDAGADLAKLIRLLIDGDVEAALPQGDRGGEAAKPASHDCDCPDFGHRPIATTLRIECRWYLYS